MKFPKLFPKKKLQAATSARRAQPEYVDEPDIKLSSAVIVVLVLHLVAVGGIYMFNSIKAHQPADTDAAPAPQKIAAKTDNDNSGEDTKHAPAVSAKQAVKPVATESHKLTENKIASATLKDSGETYTVAKGDNPVIIAKKLHVNYDELLKLNKIEDPKKLQIGQKLRIPAKHKTDVASAQ